MFKRLHLCVIMIFVVFPVCHHLNLPDAAADENKKIFVCYCGRTCECNFEADKFGKCVCGESLFPSDRRPSETSEYVCGCSEDCLCGSKSDKEGDCVCGKPMKKGDA